MYCFIDSYIWVIVIQQNVAIVYHELALRLKVQRSIANKTQFLLT